MKKITVKQHSIINTILLLVGAGLILLARIIGNSPVFWVLFTLSIMVLACSIVHRLMFVRCPHCGDLWLGSRVIPDFCPKCGRPIH